MNNIILIGAEDVRRAATVMHTAAETMSNVSSNIQLVFESHQRFLDNWLLRYEQLLERIEGAS